MEVVWSWKAAPEKEVVFSLRFKNKGVPHDNPHPLHRRRRGLPIIGETHLEPCGAGGPDRRKRSTRNGDAPAAASQPPSIGHQSAGHQWLRTLSGTSSGSGLGTSADLD